MTVVVGTAGHIDHGKTTLLRALTRIDADRLPEEQRRGMTIDVGYAHLDLDDGTSIDFVDVPGHDALIGNMLVGAGEIDGAMLVVAADDGPRAQTLEHLELLDALGIRAGIAVITKADTADAARVAEVVGTTTNLLARTSLAGSPVVVASATSGDGIAAVRVALVQLRDRIEAEQAERPAGPRRLSIDRAFTVRGRGLVVTGTLRGTDLRAGEALRLEPNNVAVRVRGLQVHHGPVDVAPHGRTAINLAGTDLDHLGRGSVLTSGPGVETSSRLLVALSQPVDLGSPVPRRSRPAWPPADGTRVRLHIGTAQVEAVVGRHGCEGVTLPDDRVTALVRLSGPVATFVGDRGVLRRPSPGDVVAGLEVLDPAPARGISRRRATPERFAVLATAVRDGDPDGAADALVGLHGALATQRVVAVTAALASPALASPALTRSTPPAPPALASPVPPAFASGDAGAPSGRVASGGAPSAADPAKATNDGLILAPDIRDALEAAALGLVGDFHRDHPVESGVQLSALRPGLRAAIRRLVSIRREAAGAADVAIDAIIDDLVARRKLARDGDRLREPERSAGPPPALAAAMDRLEALVNVAAPPDLSAAARTAACPAEGIRSLESAGRIVRVEADLAWAAPAFHRLAGVALGLARRAPLTPAALRDATGTSRRYVMPLIEDLNRRGILARTPAGHVPGPRAPRDPREPEAQT